MWVGPERFDDIPQPSISKLKDYVLSYSKQKKKAILIHGPPGSCKTSAVHALARDSNLELVEVNASDFRTADEIKSKVGNAVFQMSLFGGKKVVFIDEVDGISGQKDRGGVKEILNIMSKSSFPIIIAANDAYDDKLKSLRSKCLLIEFPAITTQSTADVLLSASDKAGFDIGHPIVKSIARRSGGDLRGALLDAQVLAISNQLTLDDVHSLSDRERSESIMQALVKILKTTDPVVAKTALDSVDEDINEVILWLDENIPKEYEGANLARAYDTLSRADVFRGRIRRWQYWRYLAYVNELITAGIAVAKDEKKGGFTKYDRNKRLLKIWMANRRYAKRKEIAQKLAKHCHCSSRKALDFLSMLKPVLINEVSSLDLDEEHADWLKK